MKPSRGLLRSLSRDRGLSDKANVRAEIHQRKDVLADSNAGKRWENVGERSANENPKIFARKVKVVRFVRFTYVII